MIHHPRWSHEHHEHPGLSTALDASLAVLLALFALWAIVVFGLLLHGALKAGA